jgi:hypothetical protein
MLKAEPRRYDVIALRDTRVACMKRETFHWLLDHSIAFNRFVINQINERLGLFIGLLESERLADVDARVARAIAALFHPVLQPGIESRISISQEEIGLPRRRFAAAGQSQHADPGEIRLPGRQVRRRDGARPRRAAPLRRLNPMPKRKSAPRRRGASADFHSAPINTGKSRAPSCGRDSRRRPSP